MTSRSLTALAGTANNTCRILLLIAALILAGCAGSNLSPEPQSSAKPNMNQSDVNRYQAALAELDRGNTTEAIRVLQTLLGRYPGDTELNLNLAAAYYLSDDFEQAGQVLDQAAMQTDGIPQAHNLRGLLAVLRGEYQVAEQHYLAALAADSRHAYSHYNLALLYDIFYQDIAASLPHYQRYLSLIDSEDEETAAWARQIEASLAQGR